VVAGLNLEPWLQQNLGPCDSVPPLPIGGYGVLLIRLWWRGFHCGKSKLVSAMC